jgi:hypothetical protein
VVFVPTAVVVYIALQLSMTLVGVPYLHDSIIDDPPGVYEVSSHFFWDWVVHPLAFLFIGATSASCAITIAGAIAPAQTTTAIRVVAGLLLLLALGNIVLTIITIHRNPNAATVSALGTNTSAGVTALLYALYMHSHPKTTHNAA